MSKQTLKRHPSRGGCPELGVGTQPVGPPRSILRPRLGLFPTHYNFYIYTSCYVLHIEFLNKTHLNTENKKVNYFSHDLFIDSHHDFSRESYCCWEPNL
jgi:hypothetical protein